MLQYRKIMLILTGPCQKLCPPLDRHSADACDSGSSISAVGALDVSREQADRSHLFRTKRSNSEARRRKNHDIV